MPNRQRDPQREVRWRRSLAEQAGSGLSIRKFCRHQKLTEASFYFWRRTIAERDRQRKSGPGSQLDDEPTPVQFSPVHVMDEASSEDAHSQRLGRTPQLTNDPTALRAKQSPADEFTAAAICIELFGGRVLKLRESTTSGSRSCCSSRPASGSRSIFRQKR